jgi:uncharacterized membrane protein YebE (DUF533 family)
MICKDTLMMIAGGLLAGYGASKAMGGKKDFTKLEVLGPLVGGGALLGLGYMNYIKKNKGVSQPIPPVPNVKGVTDFNSSVADNTPEPITQSMSTMSPQPMRMWSNYTESNTLNTSGNASSLYDYNHIYPGFI